MYYKNGFFSSIGGFFKKLVKAPFSLVGKAVSWTGQTAGGFLKSLGISQVQLPFGLGGITFDPVTGEPITSGGTGQPYYGIQLSFMDKIKPYLPYILIGAIGLGLVFFLKK